MTASALLLEVRFHDGRYHGREWPPSPARLFQALVAGAYGGKCMSEQREIKDSAFAWLEALQPPVIAAPMCRKVRGFSTYVPNNDLDTVGGDPARIADIRGSRKTFAPRIFEPSSVLLYVWNFTDGEEHARRIVDLSERLHTLGWGLDAAFARGEILAPDAAEKNLIEHCGTVHRLARIGGSKTSLACPKPGSLASLHRRFEEARNQIGKLESGRALITTFRKPPRPDFSTVAYDCPSTYLLLDIVPGDGGSRRARVPQTLLDAAKIVERVRNAAAARLAPHHPAGLIERLVIGRGAVEAEKAKRPRFIPLPSIGSDHADQAIRRLLVEVPPNCPLPVRDIEWAIAGVALGEDHVEKDTGEIITEAARLVAAGDRSMLDHYGCDREAQRWRTVTPMVLPRLARNGRRSGKERLADEKATIAAVKQALQHIGIDPRQTTMHVQREPFHARGAKADQFRLPAYLAGRRVTHVELSLARPTTGPLVLGDGRYIGLGVMQPVADEPADALVLTIAEDCRPAVEERVRLLSAVRRAVMSLARDEQGSVERLFSGHERDGAPARSGVHEHIYFASEDADGDGRLDRIFVIAPWRVDGRCRADNQLQQRFSSVIEKLRVVRAGPVGLIRLGPARPPEEDDHYFRRARVWRTRVPFRPDRHPKGSDVTRTISQSIALSLHQQGTPRTAVEITGLQKGPRGGLSVHARLEFAVAVPGPILLGRDAHMGGGLCIAES